MLPLMKRLGGFTGKGRALFAALLCPGAAVATEEIAFFEKEIRPIFVEHCYECHSTGGEQKGGLVLDSREGWSVGGDSGPALVPGDAGASLLIESIRYENPHLEMPPKTRLSTEKIAALEKWVAMGAPDPREGTVKKVSSGMSVEEGRKFWSYRKPEQAPVPQVNATEGAGAAIDRFLLARMEAVGLAPAPTASPEARLRRLHFDLTGLPPTPEQIRAFTTDPSDEAWAREIDRLLASPQFGERWGRHWLDLARYGESYTLRGLIMREAWRYRDYVIEAFNRDLPYDQFLREQIAGDLMPREGVALTEQQRRLVASGFLALGNHNLEEQDKRQLDLDIVDEQLDTIGKAFLGQTLGCARCHDHKFDPVSARDYHALAGILANTTILAHSNVSGWLDLPLPLDPAEEVRLASHETRLATLETELKAAEKVREAAVAADPSRGTESMPAIVEAGDLPGVVVDDSEAEKVGNWKASVHTRSYIGEGYLHDENDGKGLKTLSFVARVPKRGRYEVRLAWAPGAGRSPSVPILISSADGDFPMRFDLSGTPPIEGRFASLGQYTFETNGANFVLISNEGTSGYVVADAVQFIPVEDLEKPVEAPSGPRDEQAAQRRREAVAEVARLKKEIVALKESGPSRPKYLGVKERENPVDLPVLARGIVHQPTGDPVPRGFLQVTQAEAVPVHITPGQSGRLELADWIASSENPLTARVFVNRVWHWMFGSGLVRTTDNFGTTGEAPSHPELLDWLAVRFMEEGWSVKTLIREIALTNAYQRSAPGDETPWIQADPENRLFSRAPRRRLEAEAMRDAILAASGRLDPAAGGPTIRPAASNDYSYEQDSLRRSIYLPALRNSLPEFLEAFNLADPSRTTGRRDLGTIAPQALLMLNHPFVLEEAKHAAKRVCEEGTCNESRLEFATYRVLGRAPLESERALVSSLLAATPAGGEEEAWSTILQGLFASLDFRYLE
jgi:mono/diheme cytochrome c family protein